MTKKRRKPRKVRKAAEPNKVIHGSCLDPLVGLPAIADNSIDHTITDPPYEDECHGGDRMWRLNGGNMRKKKLDFQAMSEDERFVVAKHIVRVTRGWALVFCQDEAVHLWRAALVDAAGAKWRRTCIWHKTDAQPKIAGDGPGQGHEPFVAVWCGTGKSIWNGGGRSNVWSYASGRNEFHDTQKPIALMRDLVINFSMPGELILDPYAGSGSTLVAAKECGRAWYGYEMQEQYADVIRQRIDGARVRSQFELLKSTSRKVKKKAAGIEEPTWTQGSLLPEGDDE